jgi:[lysine-biosynthesis-protein LysW]---L-2-aminoadipate ligase
VRFVVVAHARSETNDALAGAAASLGLPALVLSPRDALRTLEPGDVALGRLDVREELDGIEMGMSELEQIAAAGGILLNPPSSLAAAHDKLLTARVLRRAGIPHPRTWLMGDGAPSPAPELPVVLKPRFGSWGRDVARCETADSLACTLAHFGHRPWFAECGVLAQELVPPLGWDLRLVVAGGEVVGCARRVAAPGEWRTNVALGARPIATTPSPEACELALSAARQLGIDFAGVDLLPDDGGWVVLEVNGAVDMRPSYSLGTDVFSAALASLERSVDNKPSLASQW